MPQLPVSTGAISVVTDDLATVRQVSLSCTIVVMLIISFLSTEPEAGDHEVSSPHEFHYRSFPGVQSNGPCVQATVDSFIFPLKKLMTNDPSPLLSMQLVMGALYHKFNDTVTLVFTRRLHTKIMPSAPIVNCQYVISFSTLTENLLL